MIKLTGARLFPIPIAIMGLLLSCNDSGAPWEKGGNEIKAPSSAQVVTMSPVETTSSASAEKALPVVADKPYQIIDGKISQNAVEGWKTYNGGGCGTCHGKGGIGAVGPDLAESVAKKISKDKFMDIVINGRPGTMMRPHKTNKRVMDNLDNLYAYLAARGDDVLGPGNLIKSPFGK